jgi:membrane fusion protein, multidrug efflux system
MMTSTILARSTAFLPAKSVNPSRLKQLALATPTVVIVAGAGWYATEWWRTGRFIETTDDAYAGGEVTPVSPHVAGFIAEVLVADNQHVTVGQLLIRLDQRDFRAALNHAQAVADERQAMLASLEAKSVLQQQVIAEAEAALATKTAKATFAAVDAARYRDLAGTGYGSRQDAQRTSATEQEAQSAIRATHAMLVAAHQQMLVLQAEIAGAHAGLLRHRPISRPRASTSTTPKSVRRSTVMLATAPEEWAPTLLVAPISSA